MNIHLALAVSDFSMLGGTNQWLLWANQAVEARCSVVFTFLSRSPSSPQRASLAVGFRHHLGQADLETTAPLVHFCSLPHDWYIATEHLGQHHTQIFQRPRSDLFHGCMQLTKAVAKGLAGIFGVCSVCCASIITSFFRWNCLNLRCAPSLPFQHRVSLRPIITQPCGDAEMGSQRFRKRTTKQLWISMNLTSQNWFQLSICSSSSYWNWK